MFFWCVFFRHRCYGHWILLLSFQSVLIVRNPRYLFIFFSMKIWLMAFISFKELARLLLIIMILLQQKLNNSCTCITFIIHIKMKNYWGIKWSFLYNSFKRNGSLWMYICTNKTRIKMIHVFWFYFHNLQVLSHLKMPQMMENG